MHPFRGLILHCLFVSVVYVTAASLTQRGKHSNTTVKALLLKKLFLLLLFKSENPPVLQISLFLCKINNDQHLKEQRLLIHNSQIFTHIHTQIIIIFKTNVSKNINKIFEKTEKLGKMENEFNINLL